MSQVESLPLLLKQLGLSSMLDQWELLQEQAINGQWSHGAYLAKEVSAIN